MTSLRKRLRRGYLLERVGGRFVRDIQSLATTLALAATTPRKGHAAVVTLNADEENATVQAVFLGQRIDVEHITFVTPSPEVSKISIRLAARRLELPVPKQVHFRDLRYRTLLSEYMHSKETYSTHVLLPGRALNKRRRHVHLTHGSGPKPDTTFRAPTTVLASVTPQWVPQQLQEYKLPSNTEIIEYMPRMEIMRRSVGDTTILERLGLDPTKPLVVWAPTYRKLLRGSELRTSGQPISVSDPQFLATVTAVAKARQATLVVKPHPREDDEYSALGIITLTNDILRAAGVTSYELFGVADLVITDYSSIYIERMVLGLEYLILAHDKAEFARSYRGFRQG